MKAENLISSKDSHGFSADEHLSKTYLLQLERECESVDESYMNKRLLKALAKGKNVYHVMLIVR